MSFTPAVSNHWAVDWYQAVDHLVPGGTERINNLYCFTLLTIGVCGVSLSITSVFAS